MGGHFEHIWLYGDVSPSIYILFWQPCLNRKTFWRSWSKRVFDIFCLVNDSDFACCSKISSVIIFLLWLKKHYTEVGKIISLNTHNISSLLSCDTFLSPSLRSHLYFPAGYVLGGGGQTKQSLPFPPPLLLCVLYCVWQEAGRAVFFTRLLREASTHLCTHCLDCALFIGASVAAIYMSSVTLWRNFPYVRCVISASSVRWAERTELLFFTQTQVYRM